MSDLICVLHDGEKYNNCVVFDITPELTKNITTYLKKTYGVTAKINSTYFISFVIALTLKEYTENVHIAKYHLIAPCHYNWIEGSLYTDVSRETNLNKITPFKYIKKGFKTKDMQKYDSLTIKIFTNVDTSDKKDFYIEDPDDGEVNNNSPNYNIYHKFYHYLDNVLDQYKSIENIDLERGGIVGERHDMKNIIKQTINEFIKSSNINLKNTVVVIDVGENINSIKFTYGCGTPSYYFFDHNKNLYSEGYNYFKLNE